MHDARTKRYVRDLNVFCPHKSLGCTWTGELRSLEEHLVKDIDNKEGCPFTELQCSNGCGVVMQRRLVEGHLKSECELREVKCEYCNTTGSYQWINSSHVKEAVTLHMEHILRCIEQLQMARERIDLDRVTTELANHKEMTTNGFTTIRQRHDTIVADKKAEIEELNKKLQEHEKELQACKKGYEQRLQAAEDEFKNQLQKREKDLRKPFTNEITKFRDNFDVLLNCQDWSVRLNYLHRTCNNVLPNVYIKITEFVLRSRESWHSQPFYTCDKGYKMCISVSSDNYYVSVWTLLMSGEYDNHLRWPVKGTLKIQLLNQCYDGSHTEPVDIVFDGAEDSPSCQRVLVGNKSHFGNCFETLINNKSLAKDVRKKQHYYENNTLYFKILEFVEHH